MNDMLLAAMIGGYGLIYLIGAYIGSKATVSSSWMEAAVAFGIVGVILTFVLVVAFISGFIEGVST